MKIPKQLKKNRNFKFNQKNTKTYLRLLKSEFKTHFKELMVRFNDKRNIRFISKNGKSIFPFDENQAYNEYDFRVFWHKNQIEIVYNDEIIEKNLLRKYKLTFLKNLFSQIAHHEYAHTRQFESMFYKYSQSIYNEIFNKDLEIISSDDIKRCDIKYRSITQKIQKSLKNIHILYIDHTFIEFWANSIIYDEIDSNRPAERLIERRDLMVDKECLYPDHILNPEIRYGKRILDLLELSQEHFIFKDWEPLENLFKRLNRFVRFNSSPRMRPLLSLTLLLLLLCHSNYSASSLSILQSHYIPTSSLTTLRRGKYPSNPLLSNRLGREPAIWSGRAILTLKRIFSI